MALAQMNLAQVKSKLNLLCVLLLLKAKYIFLQIIDGVSTYLCLFCYPTDYR